MRRGLSPTPWTVTSDPGTVTAATSSAAAEEKSPGISISPSERLSAPLTETLCGRRRTRCARTLEQALGVVTCRNGLDDGGLPVREEAGEEHRRLHLRRGHGQLVVDRLERAARDDDRRVAVRGLDVRSHAPQRLGDALHRASRQRLVADQLEPSVLPSEDPDKEAHERPRVAAVDRLLGRREPAQTGAVHGERVDVVLVHAHTERANGGDRRLGVGRSGRIRQSASLPRRSHR